MKTIIKVLILIVVACFTVQCTSLTKSTTKQQATLAIKTDFNHYLDAIVHQEFEKSTEYMLPEFFEIIPKQTLVTLMEKTFNNPEMEIEIREPKIIYVSDRVKKEGEKFYAKLRYSNYMDTQFIRPSNDTVQQSTEDLEFMNNLLTSALKQTFGEGNVKHNSESDKIEVYSEKDVIAISKNGETEWKFLVMEEKQKPILEKLIPKAIIDWEPQ